jgi:hypothetical protein
LPRGSDFQTKSFSIQNRWNEPVKGKEMSRTYNMHVKVKGNRTIYEILIEELGQPNHTGEDNIKKS